MSYASPDRPNRPIVGDRRVQEWLNSKRASGQDNPDVTQFLASQLSKGRGLSANVVNKYAKNAYPPSRSLAGGLFGGMGDEALDEKYGRGSAANVRGLQNAKLGKDDVYFGATEVTTPRRSTISASGGEASTPASTRYDLTVLPKWLIRQNGAAGGGPLAGDQPQERRPVDDSSLNAAREAYNRATQYKSDASPGSGGSMASAGSGSSGNLFENIASLGQSQIDDYERRFIPQLKADANLGIQETGFAIRNAIANLPDDMALQDNLDIFAKGSYRKGSRQSMFEHLQNQIA